MSFLFRISQRARPQGPARSVLMPKGALAPRNGPVYRDSAPENEEDQVSAKRADIVRRIEENEGEKKENGEGNGDMARKEALREEGADDEMKRAPLRRAASAPADAGEGEEQEQGDVQPLRRAEASDEAAEDDEPEVQPARLIRRAEEVPLDDGEKPLRQPFQSDIGPEAGGTHPDMANEEEPSALQALRRDIAPHAQPPGVSDTRGRANNRFGEETGRPPSRMPEIYEPNGANLADQDFESLGPSMFTPGQQPRSERAQVIIDQLDVLIHEPAPRSPSGRNAPDHGRLLRARYLRRL